MESVQVKLTVDVPVLVKVTGSVSGPGPTGPLNAIGFGVTAIAKVDVVCAWRYGDMIATIMSVAGTKIGLANFPQAAIFLSIH
jgi:hypothetical protein